MEEDQRLLERILVGAEDPKNLSFELLRDITDNFSEERKIGHGGFGKVYKGVLGERIVAVKRIDINENTIDDKLFRREFVSQHYNNHRNVVRCLGFCSSTYKIIEYDRSGEPIFPNVLERLLCFEYISNGSLDKHITDELRGLEWETRYEIIIGICKGLRYLHKEKNIIHMDLKPENILLDQDGKYIIPKITDFGLARPNENSHTVGKCYGTRGYWAPECMEDGKTTPACDIYSLGLIIIELVTGCKDIPNKNNVLRRWRHRWKKPPMELQYHQITRCIYIAERCREQNPEARPFISKIISYLRESESTSGQMSPLLDEDDMLKIEPLEIRLASELKDKISCSVELTNSTRNCIAFNIQLPSAPQYSAQPVRGIVQSGSMYVVTITVQAGDVREHDHADKFIVQSMQVEATEGLGQEDITERMSRAEAGKVVDEVDLMIVYEPTKPQENRKRRGDTNMLAEEVLEAKKRVEYASRKGKNKIGSSENAEAVTMDMSSSARGQYTKQLDRSNFHPPENFSHSQPTNMTYLRIASDRAMDVTRGAMGSLLHKLGVLQQEFNLETSVKEDVKSLSKELVNMQKVLRKVSDVQQANLSELVKDWACNVKEMSYDLEDFVDGFLVHSEPGSDGSGFRELTHEMCFLLEKGKSHQPIGDLIKHHISKQVQDEAQQLKESNVEHVVANATTKADIKDHRVSALYECKEPLVGIETRRDELISLFEEDGNVPKEKLRVVSIVGMGGLGKTTLANAVYKNLKAQYDHKTLVSVGQNPDVEKVLTKIIRELNKNFSGPNLDVEELIKELQEFLEDKRYFIVIDDIWDSKTWGLIGSAFPTNNHGSRVITTTRNERVARACCGDQSKNVYRMKQLSEEDSRSLFLRKIFGPGEDCPDALKDISIDILKKCGGMPLAINSIASLLEDQPMSTWDYVRKSLAAIVEGNPEIEYMKSILDLSYIHLPEYLKPCLLYICKYREDEEIYTNDLLRQWVAEGFVVSKSGRLDAEDVAGKYFKELIDRCMIEPGEKDYNNEVLSFRVHDIILELIRSKAAEENFVHVIDGLEDETGARGKIRRVSVHRNGEDDSSIVAAMKGCSHVRSVLLYRASHIPYFLVFKYVRVLQIQDDYVDVWNNIDLTGISRLFLLRYLKIVGHDGAVRLPDQVGELQQLETIDLGDAYLSNWPSDIVSLPWLSHLNVGGIVLPDGIGRMKSLRILKGVDVFLSSVENIKGLGELTNLRELGVSYQDFNDELMRLHMDAFHSSICKLSASLRTLICWGEQMYDIEDSPCWISSTPFPQGSHRIRKLKLEKFQFPRCPQWIGQLRGLCSLRIDVREVADSVSIFAGLPSLAHFHLGTGIGFIREQSVVIPGTVVLSPVEGNSETITAFQALKHLIFDCEKASLTFEKGAMPKLEKLEIHLQPEMTAHLRPEMTARWVPVGVQHLPAPTLQDIGLYVAIFPFNDEDSRRIHLAYVRDLLEGAFRPHHPGAAILLTP